MSNQNSVDPQSPFAALLLLEPEELSYEQARDGLVAVVNALESGGTPLAETMSLWRKGEELADVCERLLAGAQAQLQAATNPHGEDSPR